MGAYRRELDAAAGIAGAEMNRPLWMCLWITSTLAGCATAGPAPQVQHFTLKSDSDYQPLLKGPPQTGGMHSGHVTLKPGQQMHRHSTEANEEMLIFLQGRGQVVLGGTKVAVGAGEALYIPPQTEHEVHSEGPEDLRYVYTVAPAR